LELIARGCGTKSREHAQPRRGWSQNVQHWLVRIGLLLCAGLFVPFRIATATIRTNQEHRLMLFRPNTNERINVVYRRGDSYLPEALNQLNHFLRDRRTGEAIALDPRLFDLLSDLTGALGRVGTEVEILCGYRTRSTNELLRHTMAGVAKHSEHVLGEALDIRIPGVSTLRLRDAALRLHRGGVGYYPQSQFVHIDLGPVRRWKCPS